MSNITEDRMQTALAMTHHIQMRILGAMINGKVSSVVSRDVADMCNGISEVFDLSAIQSEKDRVFGVLLHK